MNELVCVCSVFCCFCVLLSMPQSSLDRRRSMRRESGKCYTMLDSKGRPRESALAMNSLREWSQAAGRASLLTSHSFLGDIEVVLVRHLWVHHSSSQVSFCMLGCEVAFGELCERGQMPVIRSMHEASIAAAFDGSSGGQVALQKSTKTVPTIHSLYIISSKSTAKVHQSGRVLCANLSGFASTSEQALVDWTSEKPSESDSFAALVKWLHPTAFASIGSLKVAFHMT